VVEDEPSMAELLRKGLEAEHHSVIAAFDGRAALDIAAGADLDVILLDVSCRAWMGSRSPGICEAGLLAADHADRARLGTRHHSRP